MKHTTSHFKAGLIVLLLAIGIAHSPLGPQGGVALAVEPEEVLDDPVLETHAREISKLLRCLVCQNQSIDESNAGLARDLRRVVRERLVAGDSKQQTIDYVVSRYGDYVLLRPPVRRHTLILWWAPALFGLLALAAFVIVFTRSGKHRPASYTAAALSPEENRKLAKLLKQKESRE